MICIAAIERVDRCRRVQEHGGREYAEPHVSRCEGAIKVVFCVIWNMSKDKGHVRQIPGTARLFQRFKGYAGKHKNGAKLQRGLATGRKPQQEILEGTT